MKYLKLTWHVLTTEHPFPGERWRPNRLLLLLLALSCLMSLVATAATQSVQICTTMPNSTASDALLGCPRASIVFKANPAPTDLIRAQAPTQKWVAVKDLTPLNPIYGGNPASWQLPAALGVIPGGSIVTPPVSPVCPATYSATQWTCSYTGSVATCTAPLVKDAQ